MKVVDLLGALAIIIHKMAVFPLKIITFFRHVDENRPKRNDIKNRFFVVNNFINKDTKGAKDCFYLC